MQIVAAYVRVSTDDQLEYSPDSQVKILREYAKSHGMVLPEEYIFVDEGISGRNAEKRPAFMRMIGAAKQKPKPFEAILVYSLSRFARNREDSVVYKRMLRTELGIDLISTSQDFGNDKSSILIEALLEAMDEYYSIDLAENVKRGMTEKATRGEPVASPPLGYDIKDKHFIINIQTAPIVQMIFNDFINGMGFRDIAIKLNSMGIKTKRGNDWENRTVEYILRNPVYIGNIRWNPTERTRRNYEHPDVMIVKSTHEPLVDIDTWELAQQKVADIKKSYHRYRRTSNFSDFMLQGLVKCSNCGSTLVRSTTGSLQCHSYSKGRCKVSHSITTTKVETLFLEMLDTTFALGNFELIQKQTSSISNNILDLQLRKEQQKLDRVKQAYENGIDTIEEYSTNKKNILKRIELLEAQKERPLIDAKKEFIEKNKNIIGDIKDPNLLPCEKNKLLKTFVDKIIFNRLNGKIEFLFYL